MSTVKKMLSKDLALRTLVGADLNTGAQNAPAPPPAPYGEPEPKKSATETLTENAIPIAGTGLGAYHGYRRNKSVGWAIGWGVMGSMFPILTVAIALAQGFAKPKGRK
jgi:hypothetical protein